MQPDTRCSGITSNHDGRHPTAYWSPVLPDFRHVLCDGCSERVAEMGLALHEDRRDWTRRPLVVGRGRGLRARLGQRPTAEVAA